MLGGAIGDRRIVGNVKRAQSPYGTVFQYTPQYMCFILSMQRSMVQKGDTRHKQEALKLGKAKFSLTKECVLS